MPHFFFPTANSSNRSQRTVNGVTSALYSATGAYPVYPLRSRIRTRESSFRMSISVIVSGIPPPCPLHPVAPVILTSKPTQIFKRPEPVMVTIATPHLHLLVLSHPPRVRCLISQMTANTRSGMPPARMVHPREGTQSQHPTTKALVRSFSLSAVQVIELCTE